MRQLTSDRAWEYAYKKALEEELEIQRDQLEGTEDDSFHFIRGKIRGIRLAIDIMKEARGKYKQDGDADFDE